MKLCLFGVELVLNIADQFFEHVFERHHADRAAKFVDHDGKVRMFAQKHAQQFFQRHHFRHRCQFTFDLHQIGILILHHRHEVFDVNQADRVVEILATKRKPRVLGRDCFLRVRLEIVLEIEINNFVARRHDIAHDALAKIENVHDELAAKRGNFFRFRNNPRKRKFEDLCRTQIAGLKRK